MANLIYNRGKYLLATGGVNLASADLRVLLTQSSYTANADHNFVSDITGEVSVSGYARQTLANKTVTEDDTNDFAYLDADDAPFATLAAGQTVGGAVLYVHNASDGAAALVAFYDLTDTATNGGTITVQWATPANGGVLKLA